VWNKIDLGGWPPRVDSSREPVEIYLSAKTGAGLAELKEQLKIAMGFRSAGEAPYIARRRHLEAIDKARAHFQNAQAAIGARQDAELIAEELRLAQKSLGEITGEVSVDDLLGRIFSDFCIGK